MSKIIYLFLMINNIYNVFFINFVMNDKFKINFSFGLNVVFLIFLILGGIVWADTNGVWHLAEDVRPGVFGSDEGMITGYSFVNPLSLNSDTTYKGVELDARFINEGQINSISSNMIVDNTISSVDVGFNYANSVSKGGIAVDSDKLDGYDWNNVPIIKDKDNAGYYVDPSSVTRLNSLRVAEICDENGANCVDVSEGLGGGAVSEPGSQIFTSSGTFTVPAGVNMVYVTAVGGGGGGGGGVASGYDVNIAASGGGGGSGYYVEDKMVFVTPGSSIPITIGAGGNGGAAKTKGGNGGTTLFGSYLSVSGGIGGAGAPGAYGPNAGGAGGASGGQSQRGNYVYPCYKEAGQNGGNIGGNLGGILPTISTHYVSESACCYGASGGGGGASIFGNGGNGGSCVGPSNGQAGSAGIGYGAGGGGGGSSYSGRIPGVGGVGKSGMVKIVWF